MSRFDMRYNLKTHDEYCYRCGSKLEVKTWLYGFDQRTGETRTGYTLYCSKFPYPWIADITGHSWTQFNYDGEEMIDYP